MADMKMEAEKYNGWTNYETWVVKLWMDNHEGTYRYWLEETEKYAARTAEDFVPPLFSFETAHDRNVRDLADAIKTETTEAMPDLGASVWADLLGATISEVNFYEIAENLLSEYDA